MSRINQRIVRRLICVVLITTVTGTLGDERGVSRLPGGNLLLGGMTAATTVDAGHGSLDGFAVAFHDDHLNQTLLPGDVNEEGFVNLLAVTK